jgi:hypothetical protein
MVLLTMMKNVTGLHLPPLTAPETVLSHSVVMVSLNTTLESNVIMEMLTRTLPLTDAHQSVLSTDVVKLLLAKLLTSTPFSEAT